MAKPVRKLQITDHACVRYLERAHGISLDNIREELTTPAGEMLGRNKMSGNVQLPSGGRGIIKDGIMVTVVT